MSWRWYYPYHYAPLAADLTRARLSLLRISMESGTPFQPFQQLLAVLPRASASLLPPQFARLMTESAIASAYPDKFQVDMDGKNWEWEAVVLIPFMQEQVLVEASNSVDSLSLTEAERARNTHGRNKLYLYAPLQGSSRTARTGTSALPAGAPAAGAAAEGAGAAEEVSQASPMRKSLSYSLANIYIHTHTHTHTHTHPHTPTHT